MRIFISSLAAVVVILNTSHPALANTCTFLADAEIGGKTMKIEECWNLKNWSLKDLREFCQPDPEDESDAKVTKCEGSNCICKIGAIGKCKAKMPESMVGKSLPEEYFTENGITGEARKNIEDNLKKLNAESKTPWGGKTVEIFYYKGASNDALKKYCKERQGSYTSLK